MSLHGLRITVAVLVGTLVVSRTLGGEIDLAPRFEFGTRIHYISHGLIEHDIRIEPATTADKMTVRTESGMTFEVTRVEPDGSATIEWTLRYMAISATGMLPGIGEMLDYDSRKAQTSLSPLAPMFAGLVNKPVTVRIDALGNVVDFKGFGAGGLMGPLGFIMQGFMSRSAFEQLPLFVTSGAPKNPRNGAKWSRSTSVQMPLAAGSIVMDQDFIVKRFQSSRRTVEIEMKGTLRKSTAGAFPSPGGRPTGTRAPLEVSAGTVSGLFVWDYQRGQLSSAESQMKLNTEIDTLVGRMHLQQDMSSSVKRVEERRFD